MNEKNSQRKRDRDRQRERKKGRPSQQQVINLGKETEEHGFID